MAKSMEWVEHINRPHQNALIVDPADFRPAPNYTAFPLINSQIASPRTVTRRKCDIETFARPQKECAGKSEI